LRRSTAADGQAIFTFYHPRRHGQRVPNPFSAWQEDRLPRDFRHIKTQPLALIL
jgi:hypothetical protein